MLPGCWTLRLRDAARLFDFQASGCYRLKGCNISFRLLDYLHNKHSSCLSTCQSLRLSSCWAARLSNSRAVSWQIVGLSGWKKADSRHTVRRPYCLAVRLCLFIFSSPSVVTDVRVTLGNAECIFNSNNNTTNNNNNINETFLQQTYNRSFESGK